MLNDKKHHLNKIHMTSVLPIKQDRNETQCSSNIKIIYDFLKTSISDPEWRKQIILNLRLSQNL